MDLVGIHLLFFVNQEVNGGTWQLLGSFSLEPSQNHRIELSDQANGTVMADAVYVVPSGTPPNTVTWTPTLTAAETVDIYAKWTSDADRANTVTYTVHHAGGSTPITVNQQQNGGTWNYLGQFSFVPAIAEKTIEIWSGFLRCVDRQ